MIDITTAKDLMNDYPDFDNLMLQAGKVALNRFDDFSLKTTTWEFQDGSRIRMDAINRTYRIVA